MYLLDAHTGISYPGIADLPFGQVPSAVVYIALRLRP